MIRIVSVRCSSRSEYGEKFICPLVPVHLPLVEEQRDSCSDTLRSTYAREYLAEYLVLNHSTVYLVFCTKHNITGLKDI